MRVFSLNLGLLATASLALASACKPRPSRTSSASSSSIQPSSAAPSAPSSMMSSSVLSSLIPNSSLIASSSSSASPSSSSASASVSTSASASASSSAADPLTTFTLTGSHSANTAVDGAQPGVYGSGNWAIEFNSPSYVVEPFSIQPGTNYLMVGVQYVFYDPSNYFIISVDADYSGDAQPLVCSLPATAGTALACSVQGSPDITAFYTDDTTESTLIYMETPAIASLAYPVDLIAQPVDWSE